MPAHLPSSFASAAAGQGSTPETRVSRGEGHWSRTSPRPANGTQILRRSSTTHFSQSNSQGDLAQSSSTMEPYAQQQANYEPIGEARYSKEQLLSIGKAQLESEAGPCDISTLLIDEWDPSLSKGTNGRGWGKSSETKDIPGSYICWDSTGSHRPIAFEEMSAEENSIFAGDVNSPLKPPSLNQNKDTNAPSQNGRKPSLSQNSNNFGLSSPSSSRPSTRRRGTNESSSYPAGLTSPSGAGRFSRDEPSPFFSRRHNDTKDIHDEVEDDKPGLNFGASMRPNPSSSALGGGTKWGVASPGVAISPMGNFGSFAIGGGSIPAALVEKKAPFGAPRGESRLAHLMPKVISEDASSKATSWRSRPRTDTDPFGDDPAPDSASLDDGQDTSPNTNISRTQGSDTPYRGRTGDVGMSNVPRFRDAHSSQSHQTPARHNEREPLSPSDTNPYGSPSDERGENGVDSFEGDNFQHNRTHGLENSAEHGPNTFTNVPRGLSIAPVDGGDRSQSSSVVGSRGLQAIGGLPALNMGGLNGWPTSGNATGTPDRENRAGFPGTFGTSMFGAMGDLQSPSLAGAGGFFGPSQTGGLPGASITSRGSKLGSLFPAAMQAQMQAPEQEFTGDGSEFKSSSNLGAIGRNAFASARETDSPMRTSRHAFEEPFPTLEAARNQGLFSSAGNAEGQPVHNQSGRGQSQASSESSNPLPTAQQRMMVMPDRMAWVYLDPQGNVQGPWSGLEMHDWYKASFFTADLSVKKVEDAEFEPLGQLIRRIGNSREPFLVPQIGVPHTLPTTQGSTPFTAAPTVPSAATSAGAVQPPFAGAFPSFGTTLTAEQQNNLERRKQEEQYLMARQREFLAQQQVNMKQMQMSGIPGSLHHHSSAHSLHSQPSYGSITSPVGMPSQAALPGVQGFFDGTSRQTQVSSQASAAMLPRGAAIGDPFRQDEVTRLSLQDRLAGINPQAQGGHPQQHLNLTLGPQPDVQRDMNLGEQSRQEDPMGFQAKLKEFHELRALHEAQELAKASMDEQVETQQQNQAFQEMVERQQAEERKVESAKPLSLTQQVQKAASAKQSPTTAFQSASPWAKISTGLPMPFPPPLQSPTPLPAPTAQRGRSTLPESLNVGTISRPDSPDMSAAAPTLAPWARDSTEASKGPSLREIQETEAREAAKAEVIAAAQRRTAQEQDQRLLATQPIAPAPGLPTSSTWGSTTSPATSSTPSAWVKPAPVKTQSVSSASSKKTLADIQREEELRKQKLVAATAAALPASAPVGKRYADLASKTTPSSSAPLAAWSTVGAGGKVKIPTGPATATPAVPHRSVSNPTVAPITATRVARPATSSRPTAANSQAGVNAASEGFTKWAKGALSKGLNSDIDVDEFVLMLSGFPLETGIIADSVYANSQLMDGRHFAEEFIRRRKLADKGLIEPANTVLTSDLSTTGEKSGGWSEVAKKGPLKEDPTAGFKVVPNKKKGKK